jgi:hypothetical protein
MAGTMQPDLFFGAFNDLVYAGLPIKVIIEYDKAFTICGDHIILGYLDVASIYTSTLIIHEPGGMMQPVVFFYLEHINIPFCFMQSLQISVSKSKLYLIRADILAHPATLPSSVYSFFPQ